MYFSTFPLISFRFSASKVALFHQLGDQNFIFILLVPFQVKIMNFVTKLCWTNCHNLLLSSLAGETYFNVIISVTISTCKE